MMTGDDRSGSSKQKGYALLRLFEYEGLYDVVEVKSNCLKMKIDHTVMKFD